MNLRKKVSSYLFYGKTRIFILAAILIFSFYLAFSFVTKGEEVLGYSTELVERNMITNSLTGNGQVSAATQTDVKFKVSGDLVYVASVEGQEVKKGVLIASLDASDAKKQIRDAELSLESAQLNLEEILTPASDLDLMQAKNNLAQAVENKSSAENDLDEIYEESINSISNTFLNFPSVMVGLQDVLFSDDLSGNGQWNFSYYGDSVSSYNDKSDAISDLAYDSYMEAEKVYDINFETYQVINRYSEKTVIETLVLETYNTAKDISNAIKDSNNLIQLYQDEYSERDLEPARLSDTHLNSLNSYTGTINSILTELLNLKNSIQDKKEAVINTERNIQEKTEIYEELVNGADEFDIRSQELTVKQRENSLKDSQEELYDCYLYTPFDGVIAEIDFNEGETISSNSIAFTLVTGQRTAEIMLNEIEIADVELGQKVNLEFDAAEDLIIEGTVSGIDTIGTVSSGVVNYGVEISFKTDNPRIKIGMSVNAEIIVEEKVDTIVISNTAISEIKDRVFVQILEEGLPKRVSVVLGLVTDLKTEVLEGLSEGDELIIGQSIISNNVIEKNVSKEAVSSDRNPNMDMMRIMKK